MAIDRSLIEKVYIETVIEVMGTLAGIKMESFIDKSEGTAATIGSPTDLVVSIDSITSTESGRELVNPRQDSDADGTRTNRITGFMLLPGARNALMLLSLSKENAFQLGALMTGLEPDELSEDDVLDGVTELVNQIAGQIRESFYETEYEFKITVPFALLGTDYTLFQKSNIERILLNFYGAGILLTMEAYFLD
ncbi:MAG: chemotaxis protein CheX [Acidobacteriota bacterium]